MKTRTFIAAGLAVRARTIATTRHLIFRRAWLWTGFLAIAMIAFGPQPIHAAVTEGWVHRHGNSIDQAHRVVLDAAGDIVVTGTTSGIDGGPLMTIKYSGSTGTVLWHKRYNAPKIPDTAAVDGNGNVVVTGQGYTAKYAAADGTLLWEQRYNLRVNSTGFPPTFFSAIAVDTSGNVVMTGPSYDEATGQFGYSTVKYASADGELLWENRYNSVLNSVHAPVVVDNSGNVVMTGPSYDEERGQWGAYTAKYAAADGALLWEKRYNEFDIHNEFGNALTVDDSGNVVVTGPGYIAKYASADGALLWEKRYSGSPTTAMAVDGSGNVVVTGSDSCTRKYAAADGMLLWDTRTNTFNQVLAMTVDTSGNVVVTGDFYYTAKYAATDGALLWEKRYNPASVSTIIPVAVAVDASGNVVVTESDYCTFKYAAADGALLWEQCNRVSDHDDYSPVAVAVDRSGNVIEIGNSHPGSMFGCYTAKYAAADGALLWERRYLAANNTDALVTGMTAMTVDDSGNVAVTGRAFNGTNTDYYTIKFAAPDGATLWEKFFNGPANVNDEATAVAVDSTGNVIVTGSSDGDYYTAKYAAADGALLWERFFNGPANGRDEAAVVAVDSSGNVVVTGRSAGATVDSYTARYAAADGAPLWERRVDAPSSRDSYPHLAMAVDGGDNVVVMSTSLNVAAIAKYAAVDGALLWQKRTNVVQRAPLAVDGSGNVVVVGYSVSNRTNPFYTAKYAAADGALLWEKPINDAAYAHALAVDTRGNVVVGSLGTTAKYAAADGALLWEKSYEGHGHDYWGRLAIGPNGMVVVTGANRSPDFVHDPAFVYATVVYRELLPAISIDRLPTGVRLRFTGESGRTYSIERASTVTGPWNTINTQTAPASGPFDYLDTNSPAAAAFYRTREP